MHRRVAAPTRLRRRLTIAFVLVAGVLAGMLAIGTFAMVRAARLEDSLERGEREARTALLLAADLSPPTDVSQFVTRFGAPAVQAVWIASGRRLDSDPASRPPLPSDVRALVRGGELAYERTEIAGTPRLVIGGRPPGTSAELYLLFSEAALHADLAQLRRVLLGAWLVVVAVSTIVGWIVARRTLAPVASASRAARSLAEGLLDTRLPSETQDEFGEWASSFNEMADALEGKIAALQAAEARERRFTADVAHELRTPLTALVNEASLLADRLDEMPPDVRRPAAMLVADVARLRRLLEDLIEISRLDAAAEPVAAADVRIDRSIDAVLKAGGWAGRVTVETKATVVRSDPRRLERIVANLVGNAVGHGRGEVAVRVRDDPENLRLEVSDHGPGIAAEDLPHIFERFYKADPARAAGGTGLGLAIALENARLLGGRIDVASAPGRGTTFTLVLPVAGSLPGGDPAVAEPADAQTETPDDTEVT